jgi:hypothetical protein
MEADPADTRSVDAFKFSLIHIRMLAGTGTHVPNCLQLLGS